jgi:hypothetical protein
MSPVVSDPEHPSSEQPAGLPEDAASDVTHAIADTQVAAASHVATTPPQSAVIVPPLSAVPVIVAMQASHAASSAAVVMDVATAVAPGSAEPPVPPVPPASVPPVPPASVPPAPEEPAALEPAAEVSGDEDEELQAPRASESAPAAANVVATSFQLFIVESPWFP